MAQGGKPEVSATLTTVSQFRQSGTYLGARGVAKAASTTWSCSCELKLIADAGIVGLLARPNAGKSTLFVASATACQAPKIADYPFTTVEPVLGVVSTRGQDFVMMEVPGLLEGAHEGVGLGDQFLRHAERARLYVHVLDGLSEDPVADFHMINRELQEFNPALAHKPQIIAVNKIDVTEVRMQRAELAEALRQAAAESPVLPNGADTPVFFISAVSGEGLDAMLGRVIEMMERLAVEEAAREEEAGAVAGSADQAQPPPAGRRTHYLLQRPGGVRGQVGAAGAAQRPGRHPGLPGAAATVAGDDRLGIARRLEDAGIEPGDTIRIGRAEMEWF